MQHDSRGFSRRTILTIVVAALLIVGSIIATAVYLGARRRALLAQVSEEAARRRTMVMVLTNEDEWRIAPGSRDPKPLNDLPIAADLASDWRTVALAGRDLWLPAEAQSIESTSPAGRPQLTISWPGRQEPLYLEWRPERHEAADKTSLRAALAGSELTYDQLMAGHDSELAAMLHVYNLTGRDIERASADDWRGVFRFVYLKDSRLPPRLHVVTPAHHLLVKYNAERTWAQVEVFDNSGKLLGQLVLNRPESAEPLGERFTDPRLLAAILEGGPGTPQATSRAVQVE